MIKLELYRLLQDISKHLDYCGWGDVWECSCALERQLPERLDAALKEGERLGYIAGENEE